MYNSTLDENQHKKKRIASRVLLIISIVLYIAATGFLLAFIIDIVTAPPVEEGQIDGTGIALAVYLIFAIIGAGVYFVTLILDIVSAALASKAELGAVWKILPICLAILSVITSIASIAYPVIALK